MNERFVNIKVDREERPDLDAIYMDAVVALTGSGGWPMTVFLTPDGEPFFGGTYFPPEPRHGLPALPQVLDAVAEAWRDRRDERATRSGASSPSTSRDAARARSASEPLDRGAARRGAREPRAQLRPASGRLRPRAEVSAAAGARVPAAHAARRRAETHRWSRHARRMARGGMYDQSAAASTATASTSAGSCRTSRRCCTTTRCSRASTSRRTRSRRRALPPDRRARRSTTWCARSLLDGGGFASAQDADTDGVEGLTFTWAPGEGAPEDLFEPFEHDRFVLRGELDDEDRVRLLEIRTERPQPLRDDKAIASWNGLALAAFAQAGRVDTATRLAEFLLGPLSTSDGRLHRTWRDGIAKGTGYLEDYADVAYGLMELHTATGEPRFLLEAYRLARVALALFADDELGGFFQAPVDGERLVARKKEVDDHPTPSGNAMFAYVLLRLARIWGDDEFERRGTSVLRLVRAGLSRSPTSFGWMLVALRPAPSAAPRARDRRRPACAGRRTHARRSGADGCDRVRTRVRCPVARRTHRGRGQDSRLCLRAVRLRAARHLTSVSSPTGSGSGFGSG